TGKLVGPNTVEVDGGRTVTGRNIVLATGSYSKTLPGLEIDGERIITSEQALNITELPNKAIVIGGGVIGAEFASAWRSLGVEVEIIEGLPRLLAAEDTDSSKQLERTFRRRGIKFHTGKFFEKVERTGSGVQVTIQGGTVIDGDLVLVAVGRGPVTDGCGYAEQGIRMDRGFVPTNEHLQTNLPHVYAVGDIVPGPQLAH